MTLLLLGFGGWRQLGWGLATDVCDGDGGVRAVTGDDPVFMSCEWSDVTTLAVSQKILNVTTSNWR